MGLHRLCKSWFPKHYANSETYLFEDVLKKKKPYACEYIDGIKICVERNLEFPKH